MMMTDGRGEAVLLLAAASKWVMERAATIVDPSCTLLPGLG